MSTSSASSFSGKAPVKTRSSRPSIPSPLSTPSYTASSLASPNSPWPSASTNQNRPPPIDTRSRGNTTPSSAGHTTFFSDSSNPSSPEEESPRPDSLVAPNDTRSVRQTVTRKPVEGSLNKAPTSPMASPTTYTASSGPATGLPRNSSIDSAISAISSSAYANNPTNNQAKSEEIAKLIQTAGSPEAVIQYLLKEKQSQAQQNSQLWRLVDKQRAMILGLNKDLEAALKDKDKYRKKLKELMASPLALKPASSQDDEKQPGIHNDVLLLRQEVESPREPVAPPFPSSPKLDSETQLDSPVDMRMAPYPITPPADRSHAHTSAVAELLNPSEDMPKPQEYALDHYDHEAEEEAADKARREKNNDQLPFNVSLPPSRSLPSHPPNKPPPKPPTANSPPTVTVMGPTPQPDEGIGKFPSPPRKPPPAPLQLRQEIRRQLDSPTIEEDTDSEYDDMEVDEIITEKRGRRRTREEDDRVREVIAVTEAEARSVSKMSNPGMAESPISPTSQPNPSSLSHNLQPGMPTTSLDAVLNGAKPRELTAPILSPGLPASPRPFGNPKLTLGNPPMSPRGGPLSPRPPRQPIPMPPGTPLIVPPTASLSDGNPLRRAMEGDNSANSKGLASPVERTAIFKGLVTDEYPDLLLSPNALPSIDVKVASSRMKPSRASLLSLTQLEEDPVFTLAVLSRADGSELWRVEKDSVSLAKLDQRLKQCPAFTARTPDRSLFTGHAPAKIDARRIVLDQYMDELLNTPLDTATAVELCKYLSNHTLPPNADETGQTFKPKDDNSSIRSDGRPTRNGYLTKKGKNFGGWKSRFFILNGPHLKYYETPGGAHLGTIKLQNAQIGKQSQNNDANAPTNHNNDEELDSQYRHAFLILEPKKKDSSNHVKHVLCAENDRERDIWVENLLQWIDYRDPEEDQPPTRPTIHDRQVSGDQLNSANRSKKGVKTAHQTSGSDTLIGMRYDTTHAGDAPHQGAPGSRPKTSGSQNDHHASMDSHSKLISAPKDPQVISDASMWGSRIGLTAPPPAPAPSHDEKKQRKRSFFGFGPKSRTSSDGQESMFGGSEGGSGATPPQNGYHGPVRQVFGAPLAEAVRYNPPTDIDVPLPSVVYRCIQYLESQNAIFEEGIFRLSGSNVVIKQLRERFNNEGDINLVTDEHFYDIHAVASLLKLYLRELPTSILTRDLHLEFMSITTEITDKDEKMAALNELSLRLPRANATLLKYLIAFLIRIINNSDVNKMTVRNVGIVFSPTLNIPAPVFAMFLQNYEAIFGVDPEEYELPSPTSESGSHSRSDSTPRFDPPPGRPSTSGSGSPRHQAWPEPIRDPVRSTPTPPLLMNLSGARASPTPSGTSRHSYEPSYLLHQSPRAVSQPLHDTGAGQEGHISQPPHRASPAYERSLLPTTAEDQNGNLAAYDQGSMGRRRESTIMMGSTSGLQHQQGSKSRLREEAHF